LYGTLLAPNAAVTYSNIWVEGDVVAKSFTMNAGTSTTAHFAPSFICAASLTVSSPAPSSTLTSMTVGTAAASTTFTATGGGGTLKWIASGLPGGVSMTTGGVLSGTPTTGGTYAVTVTVTDGTGQTATASYTLVVSGGTSGGTRLSLSAFDPGYQFMSEGDSTIAAWNIGGAVAVGGNLSIGNYENIAVSQESTYQVNPTTPADGLTVGGYLNFGAVNSGAQLTVTNGFAHVGSKPSQKTLAYSGHLHLVPSSINDSYTTPRVIVSDDQTDQTKYPIAMSGAFSFSNAYTSARAVSTAMKSATPTTCAGVTSASFSTGYGYGNLTLTDNKPNVWNVTVSQLNNMWWGLNVNTSLDGSTPLIINVTDSGSITMPNTYWTPLQLADKTSIIWNFPNATSVNYSWTEIYGSVLAPNAAVSIWNSNVYGDVIAKTLNVQASTAYLDHAVVSVSC
jgi:choice-of-anchor A domain-containing protein